MKKIYMTGRKGIRKNLTICIAVAVLLLLSAAAVIYAVSFSVRKDYDFIAATDRLTVNATQNYYAGLNAGSQVNVTRHHDTESKMQTTAFDMIVFTEGTVTVPGYSGSDLGSTYFLFDVQNDGVSEQCYIFKNIPINAAVTATGIVTNADFRVVAVPSMISYDGGAAVAVPNLYINGIFSLKIANNQTYYNENTVIADSQIYANMFFISDFSVNEELSLSVPAYMNLLYANVGLEEKLVIKHSYSGLFVIESISGEFTAADPENPLMIIDAPYAYYQTLQGVDDSLVQKLNNITNITEQQLDALCSDAVNFALGRLKAYTLKSISLPVKYQNYDAVISYKTVFEETENSAESVFSSHGIVKRQSSTVAVTVEATVTVNSKGFAKSGSRTVLVVGTSNIAVSTAFAEIFDAEMHAVFGGDEEQSQSNNIYNFDRGIDIAKLAMDFITESGTPQLTVNAVTGGNFTNGGDTFDSFVMTNSAGNITLTKLSDGQPQGGAAALSAVDKIYLKQILGSAKLELEFDVNGSKTLLSYTIIKSKQDIISLIENNMTTPFVSSANAGSNIYYLQDDMLKNDSVQVIEDSVIVSVADIESGVIALTAEKYAELIADKSILDSLLIPYNDNYYFAFNETQVYAVSSMKATETVYVLWQKFIFEEGIYSDGSPYMTFRKIEIPTAGISGGEQYEEYMRGDYFASIFSGNSRIISGDVIGNLITDRSVYMNVRFADSAGNPVIYDYLKFKADYMSGGISNTITFDYTGVAPASGHSIYYSGAGSQTYDNVDIRLLKNLYFFIDITKIPVTNTAVNFQVEFFYINSNNDKMSINTEVYSFIIPGIYRSGDFDASIYSFLIYCINDAEQKYAVLDSSFDPANMEQYIYQNYLLTDGIRLFLSLSATRANVEAALNTTVTGVDTKGIKYLANLTNLDLSGLTLSSLDGLGEASALPLTKISMSDCGITNAKLGTNLADFRSLTTVDLSLNQITSLAGILYRTVTTLNVSGQKNSALINIGGLEKLYDLRELDLSNNAILSFEPLRGLTALKSVQVYGNIVSAGSISPVYSGNFGTGGTANIPVYVQLTVAGVSVYASSSQKTVSIHLDRAAVTETIGNDLTYLTPGQWNSALILNAIIYKGVQDSDSTDILPSIIDGGSGGEYYLEEVLIADMSSTNIKVYTLRITGSIGGEVYSSTVTRLFTITFQ